MTGSLSQFAGEAKFTETMNHLLDLSLDEKNTQICLQTILLINMILTSLPEFAFESARDFFIKGHQMPGYEKADWKSDAYTMEFRK